MTSLIKQENLGNVVKDEVTFKDLPHAPLWEAMLDAAEVGPGTCLFDAGCGRGGASVLAVKRGAEANGMDVSEALIAIVQKRIPDGDFRVGRLEELPFLSETFDAIISANTIQTILEPQKALRELQRVCVSKGHVVVGLPSLPEFHEMGVVFDAVQEVMPEKLFEPGWFALSQPGILEDLLIQAGMTVLGSNEINCPYEFQDSESFWQTMRSIRFIQRAAQQGCAAQLKAAVHKAIVPFQKVQGTIHLNNRFRYVVATA